MRTSDKIREEIVKGMVADYAISVARNNNVNGDALARILREIADHVKD